MGVTTIKPTKSAETNVGLSDILEDIPKQQQRQRSNVEHPSSGAAPGRIEEHRRDT